MFEVEETKFKIKGIEYSIKPLSGDALPKFFQFLGKISPMAGTDVTKVEASKALEILDPVAMGLLHDLVMSSLLNSYKDKKPEDLDSFVSQNLLKFIEPLMKANMPSDEDDGSKPR